MEADFPCRGEGVVTSRSDSRFAGFRDARVMVTGGLGLIGSALAPRLTGLGAEGLLVGSLVPEAGGEPPDISGNRHRGGGHNAPIPAPEAVRGLFARQRV